MTIGRTGALLALTILTLDPRPARAQAFDVERALVITAGAPRGGARMSRLDAGRGGLAVSPLPASGLRTDWRTSLGFVAAAGPLVDFEGDVYAVGESGEVTKIASDGRVLSRVTTRSVQPGPAILLSDDTLVFADGTGQAVAVRDGVIAWRSPFGRPSPVHAAPIALDDGGVVVASGSDVAVLDQNGRERARIVWPEPTSHPLLSARGGVVGVSDTGTVWSWTPGSNHCVRLGSFGRNIDDSAALLDARTLVATAQTGTRLSTVDLVDGSSSRLAGPADGLWEGPPLVDAGGFLDAIENTPAGEVAVWMDRSGLARRSALLRSRTQGRPQDPRTPANPSEHAVVAAQIVDHGGHVAFATVTGSVGVVSGLLPDDPERSVSPTVEILADACGGGSSLPASRSTADAIVGLAPLPPNGLVVLCRSGLLLAIKAGRSSGDPARARL